MDQPPADATLAVLLAPDRRLAALARAHASRRETIRARILAAALDLFQEDRERAITVEQIAARAQISRRSFYRYFGSPDDILLTALCEVMNLWTYALGERPIDEPLLDSIRLTIAGFADAIGPDGEPRRLFRILELSSSTWVSIAPHLQAHVAASLREVVAGRLRHLALDEAGADGIAAALAALIMQCVGRSVLERRVLQPGDIEGVMSSLVTLVAPRGV